MAKELGMQNAKKALEALNKIAYFGEITLESLSSQPPTVSNENVYCLSAGSCLIYVHTEDDIVEVQVIDFCNNGRVYKATA